MPSSTLRVTFYISMAMVGLLALLATITTLRMNQWSLEFWRIGAHDSAPVLTQPAIPHRRAAAWLADAAIEARDVARATTLTDELVGSVDPFTRRVLGRLYSLQGDPERTIDLWTEAGDYRSLIAMATTLESQGRDGLAFDALRAAYAVNPEEGATALANFLIDRDAPDEAARLLQQAFDEHPYSFQRRHWLRAQGRMLREQEAWPEASAVFRRLMTMDPVAANIELGLLAYARGDEIDAVAVYFEAAAASDPTQGDAYRQMAGLFQRARRFADADRWYLAALAVEPERESWYIDLGNNARAANDLPAAIERYQEAARRFPDYPQSYAELALAYHLSGEHQAAIQSIERAQELVGAPNVGYSLRAAAIYEAAGLDNQAGKNFAAVLALQPDNSQAQAGMARIEAGE